MNKTKIEWTDRTVNPITGCTKVSEACQHCYAERMAKRLAGRFGYPKDEPFKVTVHPDKFAQICRGAPGSKTFICSMSDLFHEGISQIDIMAVLTWVMVSESSTFQILTKRPKRMKEVLEDYCSLAVVQETYKGGALPNLWVGVTAENQQRADERIPLLLQTPAAVRFVSVEPILGPVEFLEFGRWRTVAEGEGEWEGLDWLIIGAETGPGARPCKPEWVESLIEQCRAANVPVFVKGKLAQAFPYQEFPKVPA